MVSDQPEFYGWTSFACVLVRAEVFNDIGLMAISCILRMWPLLIRHRRQDGRF